MRRLIIQGSARSKGETHQVISLLRQELDCDFLDLKEKNIGPFCYDFTHQEDDFLPLIRDIVARYDLLIFATPVYWYAMSGVMKDFFDRISDLLTIDKKTGRKLRGKSMAMLSCGSDAVETEGFHVPFRNSADYLGMHYLGHVHTWLNDGHISEEVQLRVRAFAQLIQAVSASE